MIQRMQWARTMTLAVALGLAGGAVAQDKKVEKKGSNRGTPTAPAAGSAAAGVEALALAARLAKYGDANKDALSLIVAARMVKDAAPGESKADGKTNKPGDAKNKPDTLSVNALLERAKAAAGGRADLVALADDVAKSGARGAVRGPGGTRTVVRSRTTDVFRVAFEGGEPARVSISGDGDSDLDLYIYDENGNEICKDVGPSDDAVCRWNPRWTGMFTIRVRNLGVANEYRLSHN